MALAKKSVEVAAGLGAEMVRVTAGQAHPETGREDGIRWATEGLQRLVERDPGIRRPPGLREPCKARGVGVHRFLPAPGYLPEHPAGHRRCRAGAQLRHGECDGLQPDPLELLDQCIGRVVSIHAADTAVRGELKPVLLGTGVAPFDAMFRRLVRPAGTTGSASRRRRFRGGPASKRPRSLSESDGASAHRRFVDESTKHPGMPDHPGATRWGKGLMIGVELVRDLATKAPFSPDVKFGLRVGKRCLDHGLLLRFDPQWVAFGPALIVTEADIDTMVDILEQSSREVLREH